MFGVAAGSAGLFLWFVGRPPPGASDRAVTPTHSDAATPAPDPRAAAAPPHASPAEAVEPQPQVPLDQDADRRRRISAKAQRATEARGRDRGAVQSGGPPELDETLAAPAALAPVELSDRIQVGPPLDQFFGAPNAWEIPLAEPPRAYVADLDNDGMGEFFFVEFEARRMLFYDRESDDAPYRLVGIQATDGWPQAGVAVADLDANGFLDIIQPGSSKRTTTLLNHGGWNFTYRRVNVKWGAVAAATADLNGDDAPDVLFANHKGAVLYLNDGAGTLLRNERLVHGPVGRPILADFTGDGARDVVTLSRSLGNTLPNDTTITAVPLGKAEQALAAPPATSYPAPLQSLVAINLTHAAAHDLIATVAGGTDIVLFRNGGDGTFTAEPMTGARAGRSMLVADINHDGWDDLIVGPAVFLNAEGTLRPWAIFPYALWWRIIAYTHMDSDPYKDIVLYEPRRQWVMVYPGRAPAMVE